MLPLITDGCATQLRTLPLPGSGVYGLKDGRQCLRCSLRNRRLIRRSAAIAAVVGTALVAINQGNRLIGGEAGPDLYWKIPLTFVVPYIVATVGALLNTRE